VEPAELGQEKCVWTTPLVVTHQKSPENKGLAYAMNQSKLFPCAVVCYFLFMCTGRRQRNFRWNRTKL